MLEEGATIIDVGVQSSKPGSKQINDLEELRIKYPSEKLGNLPIHNLLIFTEPRWSEAYKCWVYDYEYGLGCTSEGSALEIDLEISKDIGFKIF